MQAAATSATVSTILRLHDPARIDLLELALMSLCGQRHPFIEPVIVLQAFSAEQEAEVRRVCARLPWPEEARPACIVNLADLPKGDHRAALINAGLSTASGDYLGFLDFDDYLYPNAYGALIERMERSGKGAAFGSLAIAEIDPSSPGGICVGKKPFPTSRSKYDVFRKNIYPIHSFLVRRELIQPLRIPEDLTVLEDYYLLLQLLKDHDWDDALVGRQPIGDYVYWLDRSNTVANASGETAKDGPWPKARARIETLKEELQVRVSLPQFQRLVEQDQRRGVLPAGGAIPDPAILFPRMTLRLMPLVGLRRRLGGQFDKLDHDGESLTLVARIQRPEGASAPVAAHLFLHRSSLLRPSYCYVGSLSPAKAADGSPEMLDIAGGLPLTASRMKKGRNHLTLFLQTADGRIWRTQASSTPSEVRQQLDLAA